MRLLLIALVAAAVLASPASAQRRPQPSVATAVRLCEDVASQQMRDHCYVRELLGVLDAAGDPAREVPRIGAFAQRNGGYLAEACHMLMHGVGRAYGQEHHVRLAQLQEMLPRSNDPSCSAGFAHGLMIALGPEVLKAGPQGALASCRSSGTRYEQYSCVHGLGHAYMRSYGELLGYSLAQCRKLGEPAPDCAQGVFHDYWLSLSGSDGARQTTGATSPRALCARQAPLFVLPCWYRAYMETPPPVRLGTARSLVALCRALDGLQRSGCVTAGSVESSPDPYEQTRIGAGLDVVDALSCVHGVRAQALGGRQRAAQVRLVHGCSGFPGGARAGCYEWLGKALAVVDDGRFRCGGLGAACARGARSYRGALVTF